jgi:hypothetical protein
MSRHYPTAAALAPKAPGFWANHRAEQRRLSAIKMTPELRAALITLRDANVAKREHYDDTHGIAGCLKTNARTKAGRAIERRAFELHLDVMSALDGLLAIIDPASAEGV